jgi:hypothetical protein
MARRGPHKTTKTRSGLFNGINGMRRVFNGASMARRGPHKTTKTRSGLFNGINGMRRVFNGAHLPQPRLLLQLPFG